MYICICNALTERRLNDAIATTGSRSPADAYAACGCRAKCGKCITSIIRLLQDQGVGQQAGLQGSD